MLLLLTHHLCPKDEKDQLSALVFLATATLSFLLMTDLESNMSCLNTKGNVPFNHGNTWLRTPIKSLPNERETPLE